MLYHRDGGVTITFTALVTHSSQDVVTIFDGPSSTADGTGVLFSGSGDLSTALPTIVACESRTK